MDFDPLSDNAPPRYAIESDEEEDEYNPLNLSTLSSPSLSVKILGSLPKEKELIIATGDGGKFWAKGAHLGEQKGTVQVNKVDVGLVFIPAWGDTTVIVSESLTRLPVWLQHSYAFHIVEQLKPTKLALLDTYSAPIYASPKPIPIHDAPIRYLATAHEVHTLIKANAKPFVPPNLIQSTSAAYISIASTSHPTNCTLILLPSAHIPRPPPTTILLPDISRLPEDLDLWSTDLMNLSQQLLLAAIGQKGQSRWASTDPQMPKSEKRLHRASDNSLYI
ncbi:hypothetical protein APHAL10511_008011 [Amanita phalloides]|nr:hypothetical protein APHAL10511_008011 [Amanita phalloides]